MCPYVNRVCSVSCDYINIFSYMAAWKRTLINGAQYGALQYIGKETLITPNKVAVLWNIYPSTNFCFLGYFIIPVYLLCTLLLSFHSYYCYFIGCYLYTVWGYYIIKVALIQITYGIFSYLLKGEYNCCILVKVLWGYFLYFVRQSH